MLLFGKDLSSSKDVEEWFWLWDPLKFGYHDVA